MAWPDYSCGDDLGLFSYRVQVGMTSDTVSWYVRMDECTRAEGGMSKELIPSATIELLWASALLAII